MKKKLKVKKIDELDNEEKKQVAEMQTDLYMKMNPMMQREWLGKDIRGDTKIQNSMFSHDDLIEMLPGVVIGNMDKKIYYQVQNNVSDIYFRFLNNDPVFELKKAVWDGPGLDDLKVDENEEIITKKLSDLKDLKVIIPVIWF